MTCDGDNKGSDHLPSDSTESPLTTQSEDSFAEKSYSYPIVAGRRTPYVNPEAAYWVSEQTSMEEVLAFHKSFPTHTPTRLVALPSVAKELGVAALYVKEESQRCGLPSFKILGASWAICRAVAAYINLPASTDLQILAEAAQAKGVVLVAATKGNHGRAVAKSAKKLGLEARILVPKDMCNKTIELIQSEGADVTVTEGDYDGAVVVARAVSEGLTAGILIQDTAFEGYEEIPQWIVDGYSTMMAEVESQLDGKPPDLIVTPIGVGSFGQAVVNYSKAAGRGTRVLAVEPDTAGCLYKSLRSGLSRPVKTGITMMAGMDCGTVSTLAWPILKAGVDVSVTISDIEAHRAIGEMTGFGVDAGPCGAAALAGLRFACANGLEALGLTGKSTVVLVSTEGSRSYEVPLDVGISDPVELTRALIQINSTNPDLSKAGGVGEKPIAEYITAWMEHRDIECHWLEEIPNRPSIVGVVRGSGGGKSLMMNGHLDTVTTAGYHGDPLSGQIRDGSVYGRGAFDMKAGLAAALVALAQAKAVKFRGDVIFAGVADEENMSFGTEELLKAGWRADGSVVMEPTFLDTVLAHKGFVWFEVDIYGRAAHGSRYDLGIDAICKAGYFLVELDKYSQDLLQGEEDSDLGTGSVHASLIQGGEEPSSYPAKCTVTIERRTIPGETEACTTAELKEILNNLKATVPDFQYDIRVSAARPSFKIAKDTPFVQCAIRGIEGGLGRPATFRGEKFWTDCALLAEKGIPSLLFGVDGEGAHAATEWATVDSIRKLTKALGLIAKEFCA